MSPTILLAWLRSSLFISGSILISATCVIMLFLSSQLIDLVAQGVESQQAINSAFETFEIREEPLSVSEYQGIQGQLAAIHPELEITVDPQEKKLKIVTENQAHFLNFENALASLVGTAKRIHWQIESGCIGRACAGKSITTLISGKHQLLIIK